MIKADLMSRHVPLLRWTLHAQDSKGQLDMRVFDDLRVDRRRDTHKAEREARADRRLRRCRSAGFNIRGSIATKVHGAT